MSQAPPPFVPPSPVQKRNNNTLIIVIILVVVLVPCIGLGALGFFGFSLFKNDLQPMVGCALALTEVRDAVVVYAEAHDGLLPKAETWQDEVRETYRSQIEKHKDRFGPFKIMSADGEWGCETSGDGRRTGIAFNEDLSGKKLSEIKNPHRTILVFEIDKPAPNAHQPYVERDDKNSPRIFGEERGWLKMPVSGEDKDNNINFSFGSNGMKKVETGADSEPDKAPSEGDPAEDTAGSAN